MLRTSTGLGGRLAGLEPGDVLSRRLVAGLTNLTRRLANPADVLGKNPDSLTYSRGLVQTVRGGQATCHVSGPQNPDTDMANYLLPINTDLPVPSSTETAALSTDVIYPMIR